MNRSITISLVALLLSLPLLGAETREWTSSDGKKVTAELISHNDSEVVLKIKDKTHTLPLSRLSKDDQTWLNNKRKTEEAARKKLLSQAGKVVSHPAKNPDGIPYHVYYPSQFDPNSPPPLLILFSPGGNGKDIVKKVTQSCDKHQWIAVGCDRLRNGGDIKDDHEDFKILLAHLIETLPVDPESLYLGGFSGGGLRALQYTAQLEYPWKGVLSFGGWLNKETDVKFPKKMPIAIINGDKDKNANAWVEVDTAVMKKRRCKVEYYTFPGGHTIAPPDVITKAMSFLIKNRVKNKK